MSTETLSMRDYRLTDNELITFTHSLSMAMTRDLTELANYGVTAAKITGLVKMADDFQIFPTDDILRAELSYAIEQRDAARKALTSIMRSVSVRAKAVFGENSAKYRALNPGNINLIFKDRLLDTAIAGVIAFGVSYFIFPIWEHTQNIDLMKTSMKKSIAYFDTIIESLQSQKYNDQQYRLKRKDAMIALANLSDNFQRMISDPKNQQFKLEKVHQFVTTNHLLTAYTASLSQYSKQEKAYPDIDFSNWQIKIMAELLRSEYILNEEKYEHNFADESRIKPEDFVSELLEQRKKEIEEEEFYAHRDINQISYLAEIKNIREILSLIYNTAKEQRKIIESYYKTNLQS